MGEKEKKILEVLSETIADIPENGKEYLLGIGEGLRIAKERKEKKKEE